MRYSMLSKYRTELMGVAMLWIMLFHAWELTTLPAPLNIIKSAGFGGVDIFILLSAMGLTMSLLRREQSWGQFMTRRAARILPAYYVTAIPYTVFLILHTSAPVSALFWNVTTLSYWVQAEGRFNWYISGILFFYLVTPPCVRLLKRSGHRLLLIGAGIAAGLVLSRVFVTNALWGYVDVVYRIPTYLLGVLLGFYLQDDRPLGRKDVLFWFFWAVCGALYQVASSCLAGVTYLPLCRLFTFTTVPMCLVLSFLFARLPLGGLRWILRQIGASSLEIYLLNCSLFAETALLQQAVGLEHRPLVFYSIAIPANVLLGILFHKILDRVIRCIRGRNNRTASSS